MNYLNASNNLKIDVLMIAVQYIYIVENPTGTNDVRLFTSYFRLYSVAGIYASQATQLHYPRLEIITSLSRWPRKLLHLPYELREIIYNLALGANGYIYANVHDETGVKGHQFRLSTKLNPANLLRTCRQIHAEVAPILYRKNKYLLVFSTEVLRSLNFKPRSCFANFTPSIYSTFITNESKLRLQAESSGPYISFGAITFWRTISSTTYLLPLILPDAKRVIVKYTFHDPDQLVWARPNDFIMMKKDDLYRSIIDKYEGAMASHFPLHVTGSLNIELKVECTVPIVKRWSPVCQCSSCWVGRILEWRALETAFGILKYRVSQRSGRQTAGRRYLQLNPPEPENQLRLQPPDPVILKKLGEEDALDLLYTRIVSTPTFTLFTRLNKGHVQDFIKETYLALDNLRLDNLAYDRSEPMMPVFPSKPNQRYRPTSPRDWIPAGTVEFSQRDSYMLGKLSWLAGLEPSEMMTTGLSTEGLLRFMERRGWLELDPFWSSALSTRIRLLKL